MVCSPSPAFLPGAFAQDASQASPDVAVIFFHHCALAVFVILKPASHIFVGFVYDAREAHAAGARRQLSDFVLELVVRLLAWPCALSLEVVAQEVKASWLARIDYAGFGGVQAQAV